MKVGAAAHLPAFAVPACTLHASKIDSPPRRHYCFMPFSSLAALLPHSLWQDMLDAAKRLQLLVRSDGRVLTFKADPAVLTQVFGQDAAALNKKVRRHECGAPGGWWPWLFETVRCQCQPAGQAWLGSIGACRASWHVGSVRLLRRPAAIASEKLTY